MTEQLKWSLKWEFGGIVETVPVTGVRIAYTASLWKASPATRQASLTFSTSTDIAALVAQGHHPLSGYGTLYRGDIMVVQGYWTDPQIGGPGAPVSINIGQDELEDTSTVPWSGGTFPQLSDANRESLGVLRSLREVSPGPVAVFTELFEFAAQKIEGRYYPIVFGAPGTDLRPGSPALFIKTNSAPFHWMIAGHEVAAATVTLWGPDAEGNSTTVGGVDLPVYHAVDTNGRTYAYVSSADMSGNTQENVATSTAGVGIQYTSDGDYFVSWTDGNGLPAGAGDVLRYLYQLSSLAVDIGAWEGVRQRLNRYVVARFVDDEAIASDLAADLIKSLPIGAEMGPEGIRPVLWPFLDDVSAVGARVHLVEGVNFHSDQTFSYTSSDPVSRIDLSYAWNPDGGSYSKVVTVAADRSAYSAAAMQRLGQSPAAGSFKSRWFWDRRTVRALTLTMQRAIAVPRRVVRGYLSDLGLQFGGGQELTIGTPVRITSPRLSITDAPAFVSTMEVDDVGTVVTIELRDDLLLD
jgi:hypothetical protein